MRDTAQGKLEERLPYLNMLLPPAWRAAHPAAWEAVSHNTGSLVTALGSHT